MDTSRKGRDLGEYLRDCYSKQFEQLVQNNVSSIKLIYSIKLLIDINFYIR